MIPVRQSPDLQHGQAQPIDLPSLKPIQILYGFILIYDILQPDCN